MILKPINSIDVYSEKAEPIIGVFGSKKWLAVYGSSLSLVGIYKDEHQLIGGFYFLKTKKYGLTFIKLPPYTPHCGLFYVSEGKNKSSLNNFQKEVMSEVCAYISEQKSALTVLAFPSLVIDLQPFIWAKYKVVPNYTYRIDLHQSLETIKSNFDSKNRNAINKTIKEGLSVELNTLDKKTLFNFFNTSLAGTGANIYQKELQAVFSEFAEVSNSFSLEAKKDGKLVGAVFCVYDKTTCYYLLGGVNKGEGLHGTNNLLVLKSIEKAMDLGCSVFDFEGSMLKGVERFFRSFGPELIPYYTVNKASLPLEIVLKFKKRELF